MSLLVKDMLEIGRAALAEAGCNEAALDSELLCKFLFKLDNTGLFLFRPKEVDQETAEKYFTIVDLRASGIPLQYITGSQEFMGLEFDVDGNVLIPRQDTETLAEAAIAFAKNGEGSRKKHRRELRILDLCCGSGAIGISLAVHCEDQGIKAEVIMTDISAKAVGVAQRNIKKHGVDKRVTARESDIFQCFQKRFGKKKFHLIATNPPYIKTEEIAELQREIRDYEPKSALDGGPDGLDFYRRILKEGHEFLEKGGRLMLEIGWNQAAAVVAIADGTGKYGGCKVLKDLGGRDRVVVLESRN